MSFIKLSYSVIVVDPPFLFSSLSPFFFPCLPLPSLHPPAPPPLTQGVRCYAERRPVSLVGTGPHALEVWIKSNRNATARTDRLNGVRKAIAAAPLTPTAALSLHCAASPHPIPVSLLFPDSLFSLSLLHHQALVPPHRHPTEATGHTELGLGADLTQARCPSNRTAQLRDARRLHITALFRTSGLRSFILTLKRRWHYGHNIKIYLSKVTKVRSLPPVRWVSMMPLEG